MNTCNRWFGVLALCGLAATAATAGALDECMVKGDHAAVSRCLLDADREALAALYAAEGAAGTRARDLDTATGRPRANAALARSMRAFTEFRKAQCDFVKAMYASGNGADQGELACRIDLNRRRLRDLQP
jgi:uncharacterized protein YecT (DUF1311 family)